MTEKRKGRPPTLKHPVRTDLGTREHRLLLRLSRDTDRSVAYLTRQAIRRMLAEPDQVEL